MDGLTEDEEPRFVVSIESHASETVAWRQRRKGGSREDQAVREIVVSLPPKIGDYEPQQPPAIVSEADEALGAIARLDSTHGSHLAALSMLLLRAESVASSKIEQVEASMEDFARASQGTKANASATMMVASANALDRLIHSVGFDRPITLDNVLAAHRILMESDPVERYYAGRLRDMQNWIGGSDYSPLGALYVPPPPETVPGYLEDLLEFANRDDVPVLVQAAVVHAQFESIHPFTDGNGRIGRALINTVLRRRGTTASVVIPIASALVARRETYFDVLTEYRQGDVGPIIRAIAQAARSSAQESTTSARRLAEMPGQWSDAYAETHGRSPRAGSAARKILERLPREPFFTTEDMEDTIGGAASSVYRAIELLVEAEILRPLTQRKRKQVWCAGSIIDELEDLGARVARSTVREPVWSELQRQIAINWAKIAGGGIDPAVIRAVMPESVQELYKTVSAGLFASMGMPTPISLPSVGFDLEKNRRHIGVPIAPIASLPASVTEALEAIRAAQSFVGSEEDEKSRKRITDVSDDIGTDAEG